MGKYCTRCGAPMTEDQKFCPNCGAPAGTAAQQPAPAPAGSGPVRTGIPAPGFSDRVNDPEILAALKKNKKAGAVFGFFLVPLPIVGFVIYALVSGEMEVSKALLYGGIISGVFLLFALISAIRSRPSAGYEAVVTDRKSELTRRHSNTDTNARDMYMEYTVVARTTDGKTKKIVEREGSQLWAWEYLPVGERFRYHPQFAFPYERYDKGSAPYLVCVGCGRKNAVTDDRCRKCGIPLLK